jgi:hypothetical protein
VSITPFFESGGARGEQDGRQIVLFGLIELRRLARREVEKEGADIPGKTHFMSHPGIVSPQNLMFVAVGE